MSHSPPPNLTQLREKLAFKPASSASEEVTFSPLLLAPNKDDYDGTESPVLDTDELYQLAGWVAPTKETETRNETTPTEINFNDDDVETDEDSIPKSMKEIYQISNRNRRRNKEGKSAATGYCPEDEEEIDAAKAEEILGDYFSGRERRQKAKDKTTPPPSGGNSATASAMPIIAGEDIRFLVEIGWVKDANEIAKMQEELFRQDRQEDEEQLASQQQGEDVVTLSPNGGRPKRGSWKGSRSSGVMSAGMTSTPKQQRKMRPMQPRSPQ